MMSKLKVAKVEPQRAEPQPPEKFSNIDFSETMLDKLKELGIERPSPVQAHCIPAILSGKHIFAEAPTGSGKTMCYLLPIIEKIREDPYGVFALIVVPTRELVHQVTQQIDALGAGQLKITHASVMGRMDYQQQSIDLNRKPHIVTSTPGRFLDLKIQDQEAFNKLFKHLRVLVIDELDAFDRSKSARAFIREIWDYFPQARQYLFFSATLSQSKSKKYLLDHGLKNIETKDCYSYTDALLQADYVVAPTLEQKYVMCPPDFKDGYLVQLLKLIKEEKFEVPVRSVIVFVQTIKQCETISMMLTTLQYRHVALNSDMHQKLRFASLNDFRSGIKTTLIATDVASRGLDIQTVDLVINYSVPWGIDYVHRVGRTGRGTKPGFAITLMTPRDVPYLQNVEKYIKTKLTEYKVDEKAVLEILTEVQATKRAAEVMSGGSDSPFKKKSKST